MFGVQICSAEKLTLANLFIPAVAIDLSWVQSDRISCVPQNASKKNATVVVQSMT